jgi:hypothetical protein
VGQIRSSAGAQETRFPFLDDSGKPDANHPSRYFVAGGVALPSESVGAWTRRCNGAKGKFQAKRGRPSDWEIKTTDVLRPNPWKRRANRDLTFELARITTELRGTVYSVAVSKTNMKNSMAAPQAWPLLIQALVEHFAAECRELRSTGVVVSDWSA